MRLILGAGSAVVACVLASGSAVAQSPPTTDGLILWLDGDDLDGDGTPEGLGEAGQSGGSVTNWADKATADGTQSATPGGLGSPTLTPGGLNSRSVLTFNDDNLLTGAFAPVPQAQVYMVWKSNAVDGESDIAVDGLVDGARNLIDYEDFAGESPNRFGSFAGSPGQIQNYSQPMAFDGAVYETVSFNVNGPGLHNVRVNGVEVANNTTNPDAGQPFGGFTIGSLQGDILQLNGYIAEILVFDAPLGDADRLAVESYLNNKWIVPEPGSLALLAASGLPLLLSRRRRGA